MPLRELISAHTGLRAIIENDANAMTYAEWKFGAGRGRENVVCVTLGTGVGGGLILGGQLYRGSTLGAGEIGNMTIDYRGVPGPYGNYGALEEYLGNQQIANRAVALYAAAGLAREPAHCTPLLLAEAASRGDEIALALWEGNGRDARCVAGGYRLVGSTRMPSSSAAGWPMPVSSCLRPRAGPSANGQIPFSLRTSRFCRPSSGQMPV